MFRRKVTELPPCPQRPSWDDMEEDLKTSLKTDVVFTIAKKNQVDKARREDRRGSAGDKEAAGDGSADLVFLRAAEFVERNDSLLSSAASLAEEGERLREVSECLRETVEEVKKQALVAIDGC
ncbi:hypothetical protein GWK47_046344 [Chionoecetes opilio]|uniref:Uncharacterized protein n=1 Tax=Chionoecetes opilio TaxID=41210 RepID=A0A8J4YHR8_CHIOP|nr:hypothetical protein GWK47_046344 [Chionoecetes opilio]